LDFINNHKLKPVNSDAQNAAEKQQKKDDKKNIKKDTRP